MMAAAAVPAVGRSGSIDRPIFHTGHSDLYVSPFAFSNFTLYPGPRANNSAFTICADSLVIKGDSPIGIGKGYNSGGGLCK